MVALLMLCVSGQAMAAFNEGDLIRVVYSGTGSGTEYATDLGNFSNLTAQDSTYLHNTTDLFSTSSVGASSFSTMNVAYFIYSGTGAAGNGGVWTSGSAATGGYAQGGQFYSGFQTAMVTTLPVWQSVAIGNNATLLQSNAGSYWNNANNAGFGVGTMGGFLGPNASNSAEQNLTALSTAGYVDQILYYFGSNPDTNFGRGTVVATLRTLADGSTIINPQNAPNATPIPAAAYLFGSGLLGMFGLRRKMAA